MSILWNFDKYAKIEELPFDPSCINENALIPISDVELLLKAGTPLVLAVEEEDEGGGEEAKGAVKKGDTKVGISVPDLPSYTPGTVHPYSTEDAPTCFAAEDYHFILTNAQQPKLVKCVTKGYIEKAKVLAAMGAEEDPTTDWAEALAALGLYLVDELGALPGSSGGGGSGGDAIFRVNMTAAEGDAKEGGGSVYVLDKTYDDIVAADTAGKIVFLSSTVWGTLSHGYLISVAPLPESKKSGPYVVSFTAGDDQETGALVFVSDAPDGVLAYTLPTES